jgi:ABC-type lipoprotein release transport system permease subunit
MGTDEFLRFAEEVQLVLGISYTFSETYVQDTQISTDFGVYSFPGKLSFTVDGVEGPASFSPSLLDESIYKKDDEDFHIATGEIIMGTNLYISMMKASSVEVTGADFEPIDIIVHYRSRNGEALGEKAYRVVKLTTKSQNGIYMSSEDLLETRPFTVSPYALYFDDPHSANVLNDVAASRNFVVSNAELSTATRLNRLIITFSDLFRMFEVFLLAICIAYLAAFGANVIQKNKYQIGIIKSLGGKTNQLARIFLSQLLVVGAMIFALSAFGIWGATSVANHILTSSMKTHMNIDIFHYSIIDFFPDLAAIDLALVVLLTIVSSLVPLIAIHKIKPINIIKAKE